MAQVVIEVDGQGNLKLGALGLTQEATERILIAVLAGLQRELLARRVVALQREGIVVAQALPGDGQRVQ